MEMKRIIHGNHTPDNDRDGYMYNFNTSGSYDFNSHLHSCYEFIHVIHGHLLYTVEGSEYILDDGDFIMTNPCELHSFSFPDECDYQREFLHIYPGFLEKYPELIETLGSRKSGYFNRFPKSVVQKYEIDKIFRGIEKWCVNPQEETDFMVLSYTLQLVAAIHMVMRTEASERQKIITNKKNNAICDYIDHHYNEDISIASIAHSLFTSPSYMSRVFRQEMGMTIKAYLSMRRVRSAKNLIMQGQSITNAYLESGFSDYSTFYRTFVKYAGMSPDEFRKSQSNRKNSAKI